MKLRRLTRPLAALALSLTLSAGVTHAAPEEPPPAEEGAGQGRPLDGYFATLALSGMVLFIVCKTARRS